MRQISITVLFLCFGFELLWAQSESHYRGNVAGQPVYVILAPRSDSISGKYLYLGKGEWISLSGTRRGNTFELKEWSANQNTANIEISASLSMRLDTNGNKLTGSWQSLKNGKTHPIELFPSGYQITTKSHSLKIDDPGNGKKVKIPVLSPYVVGITDTIIAKKVNSLLKKYAHSYSYSSPLIDQPGRNAEEEVGYEILYSDSSLLSFSCNGSGYGGGNHGYEKGYNLSINLRTGKKLTAGSCFKRQLFHAVNDKIIEAMAHSGYHELYDGDGKSHNPGLLSPGSTFFGISPIGLEINVSDVLPHIEQGAAQSTVPYSKIQRYIDPKGPLSVFIR